MKRIWNGDFTYQAYRTILNTLKSDFPTNYLIREIPQILSQIHRPKFLVRHDVTESLAKALEMARLEHALGIRATYMIRSAPSPDAFFNTAGSSELIGSIRELGHEVGLFVADDWQTAAPTSLETYVQSETRKITQKTGFPIFSVSLQNPPPDLSYDSQFIGGKINASAPVMMKWSLQDTESFWEIDQPKPAGGEQDRALLQVIVRPDVWRA
jgi:hypothetical protein